MTNCADEVNCSIQWVDRNALLYAEGEYAVLILTTLEPGLFRRRRVIQMSSLVKGDVAPDNEPVLIEPGQQQKIIGELRKYFLQQKVRCRVEK